MITAIDPTDLNTESSGHLLLMARLLEMVVAEPRVVVQDAVATGRTEPMLVRLTRGWRQQHWRANAAADAAKIVAPPSADGDTDTVPVPKRSS